MTQNEHVMQIQINTDSNVKCHEEGITQFSEVVAEALSQYSKHITRVEVHLSDENSNKKRGPTDMRCMIEARLVGREPVVVTHHSDTLDQAVNGAAHKLSRLIESIIGRQHDRHIHGSKEESLDDFETAK